MNKKVLSTAVTMTALAVVALTGCTDASQQTEQQGSDGTTVTIPMDPVAAAEFNSAAAALLPAAVRESGVIKAVTDPTFAPYQFYATDNKSIIGWTPDLVTAIGEVLGVEIELTPAAFDTMLPGISSGKYDLAVSAFSVTEERLMTNDFVSYMVSGTGMSVALGNPKNLSTDPLSMCGHTVAASKGTQQALETLPDFTAQCIEAGEEEIDVKLFPSGNEARLALVSGRVDGWLNDSIGMGYEAKLVGDTFEVAAGPDIDAVPCGLALGKDSELTPAIAAAVKQLIDGGTYQAINEKWGFPSSIVITADQVDN